MYCQYTYNMVGVIKVKTEVLRMLKETDDYLSGQERLNVSRTAVWKVIKQLETEGYEIEAVRNRGYRLRFLGDVLSQAELESSIDSEWAGKNILYFDETDSTNTEIKKAAEKDAPHGTLAVADYQSMGKGRRGRSWAAPHGVGIWMSLLLRPELPPTCASMLTLVAALAVADGIREVCDLEAKIKWPNDIVVNGKKVCGILTEMSTELECINYIVTGIGINVANHEFPEEIRDVATSLYLETGKEVRRSQLIAAIMRAYEGYYDKFMEIFSKEMSDKYNLLTPQIDGRYSCTVTHIQRKNTKFVSEVTQDLKCEQCIFMDIFPFDYVPRDRKKQVAQSRKANILGKLLFLSGNPNPIIDYDGIKGEIMSLGCRLAYVALKLLRIKPSWIYKKYVDNATKYNKSDEKGRYVTSYEYVGSLKDKIVAKDIFPLKKVPFENTEINIPNNNDKFLKKVYGDYMKIPPENERVNHMPLIIQFEGEEPIYAEK